MKRRSFCVLSLATLGSAALARPARAALVSEGIPARGLDGKELTLPRTDIARLRSRLRGEILTEGPAYDRARKLWNGAFDRRPALIVRCHNTSDVIEAVNFAAARQLLTAVRGGGHSLSGHSVCDGGLMIDLSAMSSVHVDAQQRIARVEPGALLGELDQMAQARGLATTSGTVSHTGVCGLTLGGGFGRLARRFGLACDNLNIAELVTAEGRRLRVSTDEHPELLWGLRGGGGNFGVVTLMELKLHPVAPLMYGGQVSYAFENAREVLLALSDFMSRAPKELYVETLITSDDKGRSGVTLEVCYCGPAAQAKRVLRPLWQLGPFAELELGPARYVDLQQRYDGSNPLGRGYYVKSGYLTTLASPLIEAAVECFSREPSRSSHLSFVSLGGAVADVAPVASAYWHRKARYALVLSTSWDDPADAAGAREWAHGAWTTLEPFTTGFYVNLAGGDDIERRAQLAYGGNYTQLAHLKRRYDPANLFRLNTNIMPA